MSGLLNVLQAVVCNGEPSLVACGLGKGAVERNGIVARVGKVVTQHRRELHQVAFRIDNRAHNSVIRLVAHPVNQTHCFVLEVRTVKPFGCNQKRHGKVFFTIGGRPRIHLAKICCRNLPGKVAHMRAVIVSQVTLGKIPKFVKLMFMARERCNVHAIAHAFGADIVMTDIDDIAHVVGGIKADSFINRVPFE